MAWLHLIVRALPRLPKELAEVVRKHSEEQPEPLPPMPKDRRLLSPKSHAEMITNYKAIVAEFRAAEERLRKLRLVFHRHEMAAAIGEDAASSLFPESEAKGRG